MWICERCVKCTGCTPQLIIIIIIKKIHILNYAYQRFLAVPETKPQPSYRFDFQGSIQRERAYCQVLWTVTDCMLQYILWWGPRWGRGRGWPGRMLISKKNTVTFFSLRLMPRATFKK